MVLKCILCDQKTAGQRSSVVYTHTLQTWSADHSARFCSDCSAADWTNLPGLIHSDGAAADFGARYCSSLTPGDRAPFCPGF